MPKDQQIGGYPALSQLAGNIDEALLDSEGRCVILEFPAFVLFGVYSPANRDESRSEFRQSFVEALDTRIRNLIAAGKQVILTGDLNIIRSEMDSSNIAEGLRKEGMTMDEWQSMPTRRILNQLLFEGTLIGERDKDRQQPVLWDLCRCFHPTRMGMHTCWDTKRNTRPANVGSRIDYILCSDGIKDWFVDSNIQEGLMGSDHCPVYATMCDTVTRDGKEVTLAEVMNPASMFRAGERVRSWEQRDALALSAKLIPEFDRRRNIKDMFTRKASQTFASQITTPETDESLTQVEAVGVRGNNSAISAAAAVASAGGAEPVHYFKNAEAAPATLTPSPGLASLEAGTQIKRNSEGPADVRGPATKKSKSSAEAKTKASNGQRTLQGFFKPKNIANKGVALQTGLMSTGGSQVARDFQTPPRTGVSPMKVAAPATPPTPQNATVTKAISPERVFDPIEAKESWSKLLGKRVVPKCEHDEPCISLVTKKPGVNCGMFSFFFV